MDSNKECYNTKKITLNLLHRNALCRLTSVLNELAHAW